MTDRPIIFSTPMVRALLQGRKSQTRRIYKVPSGSYVEQGRVWAMTDGCAYGDAALPYAPGDRIYVREAHKLIDRHCDYRADWAESDQSRFRWRPSIHMPRWASRITLTVTEVRVQRLQDISTRDCIAEGIAPDLREGMEAAGGSEWAQRQAYHATYVAGYRALWNRLHGPDAWDANPWVVAVSFTVDRRNIDSLPTKP